MIHWRGIEARGVGQIPRLRAYAGDRLRGMGFEIVSPFSL